MGIFSTIIGFLAALVVLVAVHEYGHFLVARLCGVKVLRFSIGFGSRLLSWQDRHGTEYALSVIPLGGYVKMLDEREMEVPPEEKRYSFNNQHPAKKIAIAIAGPLANILLAIVVFWILLVFRGNLDIAPIVGKIEPGSIAAQAGLVEQQEIVAVDGRSTNSRTDVYMALFKRLGESGKITFTAKYPDSDFTYVSDANLDNWLRGVKDPDVIRGIGVTFYDPPRGKKISVVMADSAAEKAGLQVGDEILITDGEVTQDGNEWTQYVRARPEERMSLVVLRDGQEVKIDLVPSRKVAKDGTEYGLAGVGLPYSDEVVRIKRYGILEAIPEALRSTVNTVDMVFLSIKKLISKEISLNNLSGPIGIAKVAGDSARAGIWVFFSFLATLSVYLGVLNLLPIPVLDGGHIVYSAVEWVKGSPIPEKIQMWGYQAGLAMILCLVVVASFYDIFG